MHERTARVPVDRYTGQWQEDSDCLAVEEPLQIGLRAEGIRRHVAITMRTPGEDTSLAAGFLFTEQILRRPEEIAAWETGKGYVAAQLSAEVQVDWARLSRHSYASSSCGVCGKTSIDQLCMVLPPPEPVTWSVDPAFLCALPQRQREAQTVFAQTGGLHAAALFHRDGPLLQLSEDVGRHNALDKIIGAHWLAGAEFAETILLLSGRASFELLQKSAVAGIPLVAAVGAPSSLAVELAETAGITLAGFLRDGRFNVYAAAERVKNSRSVIG
jgi:FdhD protein